MVINPHASESRAIICSKFNVPVRSVILFVDKSDLSDSLYSFSEFTPVSTTSMPEREMCELLSCIDQDLGWVRNSIPWMNNNVFSEDVIRSKYFL